MAAREERRGGGRSREAPATASDATPGAVGPDGREGLARMGTGRFALDTRAPYPSRRGALRGWTDGSTASRPRRDELRHAPEAALSGVVLCLDPNSFPEEETVMSVDSQGLMNGRLRYVGAQEKIRRARLAVTRKGPA